MKNPFYLNSRNKTIIFFILTVLAALFAGMLSASRGDAYKEFNDTAAYKAHFSCLVNIAEINDCDGLISSNKIEFVFQYVAAFMAIFGDFYVFKFSISFLISFLLIYGVFSLSGGALLSILLLVLDFRFWEYFSNVLRLGLAVALFTLGLVLFFKPGVRMASGLRFLCVLTHLSTFPLLLSPKSKLSYVVILSIFLISFVTWSSAEVWLPLIFDYLPDESKFIYYYNLKDFEGIQIPFHYIAIIIGSLFFYKESKSSIFVAISNILYFLLGIGLMFDVIGLSYRISAMMLPFIAVSASYQVMYLSNKFESVRKEVSLISSLAVFSIFVYAFQKNLEAFIMHLK